MEPIMFYVGLLSALLRSKGADYVLRRFIFFIFFIFFIHRSFPRNYSTDFRKIFREMCILV